MEAIICKNDVRIVLSRIQGFLKKGGIIKDLYALEIDNDQMVLILHDKEIDESTAKIWWNGYSQGMKVALQ